MLLTIPVKNGEVQLGDKVRWESRRGGSPHYHKRHPATGTVIEIKQSLRERWDRIARTFEPKLRTTIHVKSDLDGRRYYYYTALTAFERIEKVT